MKAAIDVYYEENKWSAACVVFTDWSDTGPAQITRAFGSDPMPYRAGRFYERELPCLMEVLQLTDLDFDTIVIDGYVHLRTGSGKGLGASLFELLPYSPAVVGIAKNPLRIADRFLAIRRGKSKKPLFISAIGWQKEQAARSIFNMHGPHRIPSLIRAADQHARAGRSDEDD